MKPDFLVREINPSALDIYETNTGSVCSWDSCTILCFYC